MIEVQLRVNGQVVSRMHIVRERPKYLMPRGEGRGDYSIQVLSKEDEVIPAGQLLNYERANGIWRLVGKAIEAVLRPL